MEDFLCFYAENVVKLMTWQSNVAVKQSREKSNVFDF